MTSGLVQLKNQLLMSPPTVTVENDKIASALVSAETLKTIYHNPTVSRSFENSPYSDSGKYSDAPAEANLAASIFEAVARAKILTSKVAMHLEDAWRKKLFSQLDSLHDAEEWPSGSLPVTERSFFNFLRMMVLYHPRRKPGLALSSAGEIVAMWTIGDDQLTFRFLDEHLVRVSVVRTIDQRRERSIVEAVLSRLPALLEPHELHHWFNSEK